VRWEGDWVRRGCGLTSQGALDDLEVGNVAQKVCISRCVRVLGLFPVRDVTVHAIYAIDVLGLADGDHVGLVLGLLVVVCSLAHDVRESFGCRNLFFGRGRMWSSQEVVSECGCE
jgi:hypothetical protein